MTQHGRLQQYAHEQAAYWTKRARELFGLNAKRLPEPVVVFDLRGRAAGQAVLARDRRKADRVRINAVLLASHPRAMLEETVPHEIAHVAVHRMHGRNARPHGQEWRTLMQAFGVPATPCHSLPAQPVRQLQRFRYACGCYQPAWLTSIRHKRVHHGTQYRCRRCGEQLVYAPQ